jgi:type I restriction enzyme, S subunit
MSWKTVKLGYAITQRKEFITIDDSREYKRCRVQVNRKGVVLRDIVKGVLINTKKQQLCKEGDFLVAEIDAKVGGYGFVPKDLDDAIVSSHYFLFEVDETKMLKDYLAWLIKTDIIQEQINSKGSTNYAAIRPKNVLEFEIPLPTSIEEQQEVVAKLNSSYQKYSNIEKELDQQQSYLQLLRETILQEAVKGKLTKQDAADEPARELLKRIKAEKQKLIKEGKLKTEKELAAIAKDEIPFELPKGWVWCRLGEVGQINPRNIFDDNKDVSFIPMALISSEFGVTPQFERRKWKEVKSSFTHFAENDVAVAKITPCFENSKAGIFKGLINQVGAGTTELHVFRGNLNFISPEYVYLFFKSPDFLSTGENNMTGSAGQKRVPSDFIKNCLFPLPPYSEQKRIVTKVQQLQQQVSDLETQVRQSRQYAQQLLQAVLKEAFNADAIKQVDDKLKYQPALVINS